MAACEHPEHRAHLQLVHADPERPGGPSRRDLLRLGLFGGAATAAFGSSGLWSSLAHAVENGPPVAKVKDRYFLFLYFPGAWDILQSLDPRDPVAFNEGNVAKTNILPGYDKLKSGTLQTNKPLWVPDAKGQQVLLGAQLGSVIDQFKKSRVSIVRGISMDTLTHEVGRRRFITAKPPSGLLARGSSCATWLSTLLGEKEIVPNLALRTESYNVDQPNYASGLKVSSVADLVRALKASPDALSPKSTALVDAFLGQQAACPSAASRASWSVAEASRLKSKQMTAGGLDKLFDFQAKTPEMEKLRGHYGISATDASAMTGLPAQAAMAVTALTSGVSRVVSATLSEGLDTHFEDWTTQQCPRQLAAFELVSKILDDLASKPFPDQSGDNWLDHVTVLVFSEFSRGPTLNQYTGRDHHLTNACLIGGAGVVGGRVFGASSDVAMAPTAANLKTGLPQLGGEIVKPEHIYMAFQHQLGIGGDPYDLRVDPLTAILKA